ncbi:hypothetical protein ACNKHO_11605 [Shigella flexneri]
MVNKLEHAVPMAKALVAGGVRVLEVTLRTACAMDAIRAIAKRKPRMLWSARHDQRTAVERSDRSWPQFAISPGLTDNLLKAANRRTIPLIPGICLVSELMLGIEHGLKDFKFFRLKQTVA